MESVVIHYERDGFKVSFYDSLGKLVDFKEFSGRRRITLDFSNIEEVRITPYSLTEGLMIVLKGVKEFKVLEVGEVEEALGVEGGEVEEQE
ncbi:MAG: hypothetical protein QN229_05700 [Desulfurococcaceae archaeon TW002]